MPKKDATRWIDIPFVRERDAVELIRQTISQEAENSLVSATYTRQVLFFVAGAAAVGTNVSAGPIWRGESGTPQRIDAAAAGGPTGAGLEYTVKSGGTTVGTVTIADGAATGTTSNMQVSAISDNNQLTLDCGQIGSTTTGSGVTVVLECEVSLA